MIWAIVLPFWILVFNSLWANRWGAILTGIIISILIFGIHLLIMTYSRGWNFNDDYAGIAGMYSGIVLISWLLGRLIHLGIRKSMNKL